MMSMTQKVMLGKQRISSNADLKSIANSKRSSLGSI